MRLRALVVLAGVFAAACCAIGQTRIRVVHVFVALADNQHQGIVPVPAKLGNGDSPATNLYWGAAFGVKSYFRASRDWELAYAAPAPSPAVLERCVFRHRADSVYLVADAYRGSEIRQALTDFLSAAAGRDSQSLTVPARNHSVTLTIGGGADLIAYVGHDVFMDFQIQPISGASAKARPVIILACASKVFFAPYVKQAGASPLLWTTNLMAPEAYTLKAAVDGWIAGENSESIRERAAEAYNRYQHCGARAALGLFATGW
jgi:hypothetical protein